MDDKVSATEARDIVARRLQEQAQKSGQNVPFSEAQRRVRDAMNRGDNKRANNNK
jgi:hypothetical protein